MVVVLAVANVVMMVVKWCGVDGDANGVHVIGCVCEIV